MSLCGTIVVVEKKKKKKKRRKDNRKRKSIDNGGDLSDNNDDDLDNDDNEDDDSTSPLSYTYTNCDSITILQEQEQLLQQRQEEQEQSLIYNAQTTTNMGNAAIHSTYNNNEDDDDQSTIGSDQPPIFRWLNWRMDPIKSFSDWTIDVVIATPNRRKSTNGTTTINRSTTATSATTVSDLTPHLTSIQRYHVHRNVLVVESQFFQSLLYSHQREQSDTNITNSTSLNTTATTTTTTTIVTLNDIYEANVFPTFLDYMYSPGHVWITQQNAIIMLLFAKNFGMKRLQWLTKQFLKRIHNKNAIRHCQQQGSVGIRTKPNMTNSNNVIDISKKSTFKDRMNNLSNVVVTATNIQSSPTMSMVQTTTTTTTEPSICDMLLTDTISSPIDYTIRYNNRINHFTSTIHSNDDDNNCNNNMYSPIPVSTTTTTMNTTDFQKQQHHHHQQQRNNYDVSAATNTSTTGYL